MVTVEHMELTAPTITEMKPSVVNREVVMTPISCQGPSLQSTIVKADPAQYAEQRALQSSDNPLNRNNRINLWEISKTETSDYTMQLVVRGFMESFYGGHT